MPEEKNSKEISKFLENLKEAVILLDKKIENQNKKIEDLESRIFLSKEDSQRAAQPGIYPEEAKGAMPQPPPPPDKESIKDIVKEKLAARKEKDSAEGIGLEEKIGGKWFAKIGMAALVIGLSFFLKYAFDNDWVGETGRVIIGIIAGLGLLAIGEKTIRKYSVYGQIISGGGIAVLYLSIFTAFNFYHLIDQYAAFFIMIVITAVGILLSLRYNAYALMIAAVLGGFLTPVLISTGENNQFGLFSYILILDAAILVVSIFKKWRALNLLGFFGTVIIFLSWAVRFYTEAQLFSTMFFLSLFFIVYSISSLIYNIVKKEKSSGIEQVLTLLAGAAYFSASYAILDNDYHAFMGFFALILGIYYFLWAYLVRALTLDDEKLYGFLAFLTVGFITLAIPIQFKQNVITIGWAIEALILLYLGVKTYQKPIMVFGFTISALTVMRLLFVDSGMGLEDFMVVFNKRFFTFFFVVATFYVVGYMFKKIIDSNSDENITAQFKKLTAIWLISANLLTLFAVSQEIVSYYGQEIKETRVEQSKVYNEQNKYRSGYRSPSRSKEYQELNAEIRNIRYRQSIALSIFWLLYAIILLIAGFIGRYKLVRVGGMMLLSLSILKLFFYDLWSLGTLYRIISSISLGIVLLSISFVYQKYKDKIKEII